jgi:hypothetical protein
LPGKPGDVCFSYISLGILPFGGTSTLAFAGVLALAPIVTGLAAALAFTFVLAFASVFALFSVGHCLQRDAGFSTSGACGICTYRKGTCQKSGDCCAGNHCFGWSNHLLALSFCVVGVWSPSRRHCCGEKTIKQPVFYLCVRWHIYRCRRITIIPQNHQ